jgi:uncharacterized membrane protein
MDCRTGELDGSGGSSSGRCGNADQRRHGSAGSHRRSASRDWSDGNAVVIVVIVIYAVIIIVVIIAVVYTIIIIIIVVVFVDIDRDWNSSRGSRRSCHCGEGGTDGDVVVVNAIVVVVVVIGCAWGGSRGRSGRHSGYGGGDGVVIIVVVIVVVVLLSDDCCWQQGKKEVRPVNHFERECELMLAVGRWDDAKAKDGRFQ